MKYAALFCLLLLAGPAIGQEATTEPVRVDTKGVSARILFEAPIDGGHVHELIDDYKLRVTEIAIAPGAMRRSRRSSVISK